MEAISLVIFALSTLIAAFPSKPTAQINFYFTNITTTTTNTTGRGHQVNIYKNIRFAAAPIDKLRFKYPQPLTKVSSNRRLPVDTQCISSVPAVAPFPGVNGTSFGSEDCLFLDVYVPNGLPPNASVPVIHWLYGSAYAFGSKDIFTNPLGLFDELLSKDTPFVFVASNYRMGLYGFASSPDAADAVDTNIGLADGLVALEWTKLHISKFGGDPKLITAMGQSAGAGMIELMIANKHTRQLPFSRAFLSSSDLPLKRDVTERRRKLYNDILRLANCTDISCLRRLPEQNLAEINNILISQTPSGGGGGTFGPYIGFSPFVDDHVIHNLTPITLKSHPNDHTLAGIIIGNMQNEASTLSSDGDMPDAFPHLARMVLPNASDATIAHIQSLYSWPACLPQKLAWDWTGDMAFFCHALDLAETYVNKTYRYIMSVPPAVHAQDISYYFYPNFNLGFPVDEKVARGLQRMLGEFIYGKEIGVGVAGEQVVWKGFGAGRTILNITANGFEVGKADQELIERCKVVDRISEDPDNGI